MTEKRSTKQSMEMLHEAQDPQPQEPEIIAPELEPAEESGETTLAPGATHEWKSPWGTTYTFKMPSGEAYRRAVRNRQITIHEDGFSINPAIVEPLIEQYVVPKPNPAKLTPGQWDRLCFEFIGFLQRVR